MAPVPQAGAIAYRAVRPEPLWLIVTSRRRPTEWIFPKGHIEPGEQAADAAVRELHEEAGVTGRVVSPVGALSYRSGNEDVQVHYFLVEGLNDGTEAEGRQLAWLTEHEALRQLTHGDARGLLRRAATLLSGRSRMP